MESYKKPLHEFALNVSGKAGTKHFSREFVEGLLTCFGWEEMPGHIDHTIELEGGETHETGLWWPERKVMIEVRKPYVMLSMAWPEVLKSCLAIKPMPRYVIFTNRRELHLYDTKDAAREKPVLAIELEHLPKYSENLAFLKKDWDKSQGIGHVLNVEKVSKEVADRVGALYRSLIASGTDQDDAVKFTLQCIITMFAEDIGLLPKEELTLRLYRAQRGEATVQEVLGDLFTQMATKPTEPRTIRYFNGGLFSTPVVLELDDRQLRLLTKAAEANWQHVDPHIFGSVFQSIMGEEERHATGAHYTAKEDIMLVVGPTIVEPWRKRIQGATSLTELRALREELAAFRVLDPACGSGNFLYISYRELYRLETELIGRMVSEYKSEVDWATWITTTNFFGIDINPFAVELARTTLNIAKKIAFDERQEMMSTLYSQTAMMLDPSLPLDNLNDNIRCEDALFTEWPEVEAIIGNPPFLGSQKIREEIGAAYIEKLQEKFKVGVPDLCAFWFRLAHEGLPENGRAGLIATSAIRHGKTGSASLNYITSKKGVIFQAVSAMDWPGEAVVSVSVVNWIKGSLNEPKILMVKDRIFEVDEISPHLKLQPNFKAVRSIKSNRFGTSMGVTFSHEGYRLNQGETWSCEDTVIAPIATGSDFLRDLLPQSPSYCIHLTMYDLEKDVKRLAPLAYNHLRTNVYPSIQDKASAETKIIKEKEKGNSHNIQWLTYWWKPLWNRQTFFQNELLKKQRMIICSRVAARNIFDFLSSQFVPTDTLQMFAFDDDYSFGIIQSSYHWEWTKALGGRLTERIRYTTKVWKTFPWPQAPTEEHVARIGQAAQRLRQVRRELMEANEWNLRKLYQSAEEADSTHPLNVAQAELDAAVQQAYGHPSSQSIVEFLLELNQNVAEDEKEGYEVLGPGLPDEFDPTDERWMSTDCITPPPFTPSTMQDDKSTP